MHPESGYVPPDNESLPEEKVGTMAAIQDRPFAWDDIQPITEFLLESYTLTGRLFNWDPRRWQGTIYHSDDARLARHREELPQRVQVWLDADRIVGVVIPEYTGGIFLQVHPDYRQIEAAMLDWTEANQPRAKDEQGNACLYVWADEHDSLRNALLTERGYTRTEAHEIIRRRPMSQPVLDLPTPEGYLVRPMRIDPDDQQNIANLLNAAFNRTIHSAEEYRNFQHSPYYRAELDMVVEAPDGTLAANAGFNAYEQASFAQLEPVCTHPDHQGRGLAGIAIAEGLRRVQAIGIDAAFVGAWYSNPVSNHLYQKMGFTDGVSLYAWKRLDD